MQFAVLDEESGDIEGFLIDKKGEIRTYSDNVSPVDFTQYDTYLIPKNTIQSILNTSVATGKFVDKEVFGNYYHKLFINGDNGFKTVVPESKSEKTSTIYFYMNASAHSSDGCGAGDYNCDEEDVYDYLQVTVHSIGNEEITNNASITSEVVDWVQSLPLYENYLN